MCEWNRTVSGIQKRKEKQVFTSTFISNQDGHKAKKRTIIMVIDVYFRNVMR